MRSAFLIPRVLAFAVFLWIPAFGLAQDTTHLPDGGTSTRVEGVELLPIPEMPLTGKSNILWERTLPQGATIATHLQATLARDSQGRIYRERRDFTPSESTTSTYIREILILDPVAGSRTTCVAARKECIITSYMPRKHFTLPQPGWNRTQTRFLSRENLGSDQVVGYNAEGTRDTVTIKAGVVGNDRTIVNTREFWYNTELQLNVKVIRLEPEFGKQTVWLSDAMQSEPEASLFLPPSGYAIRDARVKAGAE